MVDAGMADLGAARGRIRAVRSGAGDGDVALDAFVCVAVVYFCQGLAIMAFYFRLW